MGLCLVIDCSCRSLFVFLYCSLFDFMTATQDLSFLSLIGNASILVQLVLVLLLGVSLTSWTYIFSKMFAIKKARAQTEQFERNFWSGGNLLELYQEAVSNRRNASSKMGAMLDGARRAMRAAYQREMDLLESHLSFLASVGSVSPYIGLFGTVWGIMNSFRGLANVQQATLAAVAPGIAEALIATAIGLFAAIPAVLAYNRYSHDIDRLAIRFETFIEEFSNILQRQSR